MKIYFSGKCSDMSTLVIEDDNGDRLLYYDGYVPNIPAIGGGDYFEMEIDNETGKIMGWTPLTPEKIKSIIS